MRSSPLEASERRRRGGVEQNSKKSKDAECDSLSFFFSLSLSKASESLKPNLASSNILRKKRHRALSDLPSDLLTRAIYIIKNDGRLEGEPLIEILII